MTKNNLLNQWLWKWHIIAGLITLPFMLLLAITGTIYLFKDNINNNIYQKTKFVEQPNETHRLPLSTQLLAVQNSTKAKVVGVQLPTNVEQATIFQIAGKGRATNNVYVDPYTAEVKGKIEQKETLMYLVRKLHGELLLDKVGTTVVELVASWFIVLILTGLYVWWPKNNVGTGGFLTIRFSKGKRILFRDLHSVVGFWLSIFMFIILAGGMPWTDVFGEQLKWVQKQTSSGFPQHWRNAKGLSSSSPNFNKLTPDDLKHENLSFQKVSTHKSYDDKLHDNNLGNILESKQHQLKTVSPLSIDEVESIALSYQLEGVISIKFPSTSEGVFTISNRSLLLRDQHVFHIDQYTGGIVKSLQWSEVGVLMDLRQIFMRLHQGEYGIVNWSVLLAVALFFIVTSIAGFTSYMMRKPQGSWGIPKVPERFRVDKVLVTLIILLGIIFPLFGASLLVIWGAEKISAFQNSRQLKVSNK